MKLVTTLFALFINNQRQKDKCISTVTVRRVGREETARVIYVIPSPPEAALSRVTKNERAIIGKYHIRMKKMPNDIFIIIVFSAKQTKAYGCREEQSGGEREQCLPSRAASQYARSCLA